MGIMLTYLTAWCNKGKLITVWQIFEHISTYCHNKAFYVNKYPWENKKLDLKVAFEVNSYTSTPTMGTHPHQRKE